MAKNKAAASGCTPFRIDWHLPAPTPSGIGTRRFEAAAEHWGYVVRGWPLGSDGKPLQRVLGSQAEPFTALEITVRFETFAASMKGAVARVPPESVKRLPLGKTQSVAFPYQVELHFNQARLADAFADRARFFDTIVHEIGHALGIGMDAGAFAALVSEPRAKGDPTTYRGAGAGLAFACLPGHAPPKKRGAPSPVPLDVERTSPGRAYHWSEHALQFDVMSTWLDAPSSDGRINVISAVTVGALEDMGYIVDKHNVLPLPTKDLGDELAYPAVRSPTS